MSIIRKEQLSNPLSASYAATASIATSASFATTASFALNVGTSINTGSFVTTSSFNAFTASINSFTSSINAFTASYNTGSFTGSFTGSLIGTSSWAVSASQAISSSFYRETDPIFTAVSGTFVTTSSFNNFTSSYNTGSFTGSFIGSLQGTSSWATNALLAVSASNYQEIDPVFVAKSASLATTGSNTFIGNQTITGSLTIINNLTVLGSASIQYISESTLNIGTNLITVNTNTPSVRFGGLAVIDSGSSPITSASFLYDALQDEFIFVHRGDGTNITSSHFVLGPETYNDLGNETYLTANRIPKGVGNEHLNDSNISDNGTLVNINSNTNITGSLLITGSQVIFSSSRFEMPNNIIVNSTTRRLNSGSALSVDWGNRTLHTSNNATTIDWQNRYLYGGNGQISINYGSRDLVDSTGIGSLNWDSRILSTINGRIALEWYNDYVNSSNTYLYRFYEQDTQDNFASSVQYSGEIIEAASTSSAGVAPTQYQLVSLSGSYWLPTNQTTDISTKMLGIVIVPTDDPNKGQVLIEGDITWDGSDGAYIHPGITSNDKGTPVYIRNNTNSGEMSIIPPTSGYVRIVGYVYFVKSSIYIFRFKPSNDWYKLS
jgi:hypothetical protein